MKQKNAVFSLFICIFLQNYTYSYDYLPDDIRLDQVLLIGAHNIAQSKKYGWRYYQQLGSITDQWKAGARGGKINLHWRMPMSPEQQIKETLERTSIGKAAKKTGTFIKDLFSKKKEDKKNIPNPPFIGLCHEPDGKSNCLISAAFEKVGEIQNVEKLFKELAQLLEQHPKDVAILIIESYLYQFSEANGASRYTNNHADNKLNVAIQNSGLREYCYKLTDPSVPWPTIGELRKSNKRLLIFINTNPGPYFNFYEDNFASTHWAIDAYRDIETNTCKLYNNPPYGRGFLVGNGYEQSIPIESTGGKMLEALKKIGIKIPPIKGHIVGATDFKKMNSKETIKKRVEICEKVNNKTATLLGLDMVEVGEGYAAVKEINMKRIDKLNKAKAATAQGL